MARVKTRPWDPAEHLTTNEDIVAYLKAALEDGDPELIEVVLQNIARASGLARVSKETARREEKVALVSDALQSGAVVPQLPEGWTPRPLHYHPV